MSSAPSSYLSAILDALPDAWSNTTYPNDKRFIGREAFMNEMVSMLEGKTAVDSSRLANIYPEDYLRLGSPVSTLLEVVRARQYKFVPQNTFCFSSRTLPLITLLLAARAPVTVYGPALLTEEQATLLRSPAYGCTFEWNSLAVPVADAKRVVVQVFNDASAITGAAGVDAVLSNDGFLYIVNTDKVPAHDITNQDGSVHRGIHTLRKRLGAPVPTPDAFLLMRGVTPNAKAPDVSAIKEHLKSMAGCEDVKQGDVLIATVGLAATAAMVGAALEIGGADIDSVMCSTAYGGSSQQTDIISERTGLVKHTFDIQGPTGNVFESLSAKLEAMKAGPNKPLTLIQLEYPTNPDMKDCDLSKMQPVLESYAEATGSKVVFMLDTTFSPQSKPAQHFTSSTAVIVFNSLSKSVSGGLTTGGSLVANAHPLAQQMLTRAIAHATLFDSQMRICQLETLLKAHGKVEERVALAHGNAATAAAYVEQAVTKLSGGKPLKVNFVTAAQIAKDVTPATFSFNLPAPDSMAGNNSALASLAQDLVDQLVDAYPQGVKPCVSFGQQNSLVYVTVPATSTQGVISEEDKAKQAVGGVQLVRFSFPPTMDMAGFQTAVDAALTNLYK